METLCMGLSCVVLVKMGKILDTYVCKKTNNKKMKDVIRLLVSFSILETIGAIY